MENDFAITISVDNRTAELLAVYFRLRSGKPFRTEELADGQLMADYDRKGRLVGIEMLEPCSAKIIDQIQIDESAKAFVKNGIPRQFIKGKFPSLTPAAGC